MKNTIENGCSDDIEIAEINNGNDEDLINFLITQKGEIFI